MAERDSPRLIDYACLEGLEPHVDEPLFGLA